MNPFCGGRKEIFETVNYAIICLRMKARMIPSGQTGDCGKTLEEFKVDFLVKIEAEKLCKFGGIKQLSCCMCAPLQNTLAWQQEKKKTKQK